MNEGALGGIEEMLFFSKSNDFAVEALTWLRLYRGKVSSIGCLVSISVCCVATLRRGR